MSEPITFPAQVARCQTLADGGLRVTLDLPETAVLAVAQLMECKRQGVAGEVAYRPIVTNGSTEPDATRKIKF